MFQPILEVSEYKIAMRTSEKLLTVVKDIQDLRKVILEEEYLKLIFDKETYSVLIVNTDTDELQSFIDDLNSGNGP